MAVDATLLLRAATNIAHEVGSPITANVSVVFSPGHAPLAGALQSVLGSRGLTALAVPVADGETARVTAVLSRLDPSAGYAVLLKADYAELVFELLGRPDRGLKQPCDHLFCDWFMRPEGLVQTYAVDREEQERFRQHLAEALTGARSVRVTAPGGTDITLEPRDWKHTWGETYTAPVEGVANGTIVVDGFVFWGPARQPFALQVRDGRVQNLPDLDLSDPQLQMLHENLTCDGTAAVLAELGIGVNLNADPLADLMEAEMARGTCHFGFGNNLPYGGGNSSAYHGDVGVLRPTITVDGKVICRDGVYQLP